MKGIILILSLISTALLLTCAPESVSQDKPMVTPYKAVETAIKKDWEIEWDRLVASAKKENKIMLIMSGGAASSRDPIIEAMKSKFGLEVEAIAGRGAEISAKLLAERRASIFNADVYIGGGTTIITTLKPADVIAPLEPVLLLPEVKEGKYWRTGELPWKDRDRTAIAFAAGANEGVTINTASVRREEMVSYLDLLNPKWKGKIVINDPTTSGRGLSWFQGTEKIMGFDYLKNFALQEPIITRDQRQQGEWVARGKYPLGIAVLPDMIWQYREAGAPLEPVPFKEGGRINAGAGHVALINKASHPNAARLLVNWILTREGQTLWSKSQNDLSQRVDVPTDHLPSIVIPEPGKKYFLEWVEEGEAEKPKYMAMAQEIFANFVK